MMQYSLVNRTSFIVAGATLLFSQLLFFSQTSEFFGSLMAALMTASLVWMAYVLTRFIILALKK